MGSKTEIEMGMKEGMAGICREECTDRKGQRNWAL